MISRIKKRFIKARLGRLEKIKALCNKDGELTNDEVYEFTSLVSKYGIEKLWKTDGPTVAPGTFGRWITTYCDKISILKAMKRMGKKTTMKNLCVNQDFTDKQIHKYMFIHPAPNTIRELVSLWNYKPLILCKLLKNSNYLNRVSDRVKNNPNESFRFVDLSPKYRVIHAFIHDCRSRISKSWKTKRDWAEHRKVFEIILKKYAHTKAFERFLTVLTTDRMARDKAGNLKIAKSHQLSSWLKDGTYHAHTVTSTATRGVPKMAPATTTTTNVANRRLVVNHGPVITSTRWSSYNTVRVIEKGDIGTLAPNKTARRVQNMIDETCDVSRLGKGRDSKSSGLSYDRLLVKHVYVLDSDEQNEDLDMMIRRMTHKNIKNCKTRKHLHNYTSPETILLYHGTTPRNAVHVARAGFDERVSKAGLFGHGIYFTEESSKADDYMIPDENGVCWMLITKVAMGHYMKATSKCEGIRRPPCRKRCTLPHCDHSRYDSILAVTKKTHQNAYLNHSREFVIYDRRQCVPIMLVGVKRVVRGQESSSDSSESDSDESDPTDYTSLS